VASEPWSLYRHKAQKWNERSRQVTENKIEHFLPTPESRQPCENRNLNCFKAVNVLKIKSLSHFKNQEKSKATSKALFGRQCSGTPRPVISQPNVTNEAKRLLKTKENTFSTTNEANRPMKINELFVKSQEVVDKQGG
jgi:hypothetical protein